MAAGDLRAVEDALARGARAECRSEAGLTVLGIAAELNQAKIADALITAGANVNARDGEGRTALLRAAERGHDRMIELLMAHEANVDTAGPNEMTPLIAAAWGGHTEAVRVLVEKGRPQLNARDAAGRTALTGAINVQGKNSEMARILRAAGATAGEAEADLLQAAARGDLGRVRRLLTAGARPKVEDAIGNTPLILAARRGWMRVVEELLKFHALIDAANHEGDTALLGAARAGHAEVVKELLECGAEVDRPNLRKETALFLAAGSGRVEAVQALLDRLADVEARDAHGATPLLAACGAGSSLVVRSLLEHSHRPDPDAKATYGNRPLMVALLAGSSEVADLLLRAGACRGEREALLFQAVRRGEAQRVQNLLGQGVEIDAQDLAGRTALMAAAAYGFEDVLRLLTGRGAGAGLAARDGSTALTLAARGGWTAALAALLPVLGAEWEHQVAAALLEAVRGGHVEAVRFLVEKGGADVNAKGRSGDTSLTAAVAKGQAEMVSTLLALGAEVDRPGRHGNTPLMIAILEALPAIADLLVRHNAQTGRLEANLIVEARQGNIQRVRDILDRGANVLARDRNGGSVLLASCAKGSPELVQLLLERLPDPMEKVKEVNAGDLTRRTPLLVACQRGNAQVVELLLTHGAAVDARTTAGRTPLMEAARSGHTEIVSRLIDGRADPNARDQKGNTPLKEALLGGSPDLVALLESKGAVEGAKEARLLAAIGERAVATLERLLAQGADPDAADRSQRTASMLAAGAGWTEGLKALLAAGADPAAVDGHGRTALWLAAAEGHLEALQVLREKGADPNVQARRGRTPLLEAAKRGHLPVIKELLAAGASPDAADESGATPLIEATTEGRFEIVDFLASSGDVDVNARDREGRTALTWARLTDRDDLADVLVKAGGTAGGAEAELLLAAHQGDEPRVAELIQAGADVQVRNRDGSTPLLAAARNGLTGIVSRLLSAGAETEIPDRRRRTPLLEAAQGGHLQVVEALLQHGAQVDARDKDRGTALHAAARTGAADVALVLASRDADVDARNRAGETPLLLAVRFDHPQVVEALLAREADAGVAATSGRTPLMEAAEKGSADLVRRLLAGGQADVNAIDQQGRTAWDLAFGREHDECVQILQENGTRAGDVGGGVVYVTPQGDRYHKPGCGFTNEAAEKGLLQRKTRVRAIAEGYGPCQICLPQAGDGNLRDPGAAGPAGTRLDDLRFTVFHTSRVGPQETGTLLAYAHLAASAAEVARQASARLSQKPAQWIAVGVGRTGGPLAEGSRVRVTPDVKGLVFDSQEAFLTLWQDRQSAEFSFRPAAGAPGRACHGWVHFWLGGFILASVQMTVLVLDAPGLFAGQPAQKASWPYRKIFPSYAREDLAVVEQFAHYAKALGDTYLQDVMALRAGEEWSPAIRAHIDGADVFQLFWSDHSAVSQPVGQEWRHALRLGRANFVRPVYWAEELSPPPPRALRNLHFARLS